MVEGARLESVCTSKGYRGFESRSLRKKLITILRRLLSEYFYICRVVNLNKLINNHTNGINVVINTVNYEKINCSFIHCC